MAEADKNSIPIYTFIARSVGKACSDIMEFRYVWNPYYWAGPQPEK